MHLQRLPPEEAAVRRYVEELWLPYHRELETTADAHELAEDVDMVAEELPFRVDRLEADDYRLWVAVDGVTGDVDLDADEGTLAGFVSAEVTDAPSVFDQPDRVHLGDVFVHDDYRGTGFAVDLVDRVAEFAREHDCGEVTLDVDTDNDRALAFYEKLGFDVRRYRMTASVDGL